MKFYLALFFYVFLLGLSSCAGTPPKKEYILSYAALNNAKEAEAEKLSSNLMLKAKKLYKLALSYYQEREYSKAKQYFNLSRIYSEKAELRARVIKYKKGEVLL